VTPSFLSSLGLSEPAQRRLLAAVKKEKKRNKKHLKQVLISKQKIFYKESIVWEKSSNSGLSDKFCENHRPAGGSYKPKLLGRRKEARQWDFWYRGRGRLDFTSWQN